MPKSQAISFNVKLALSVTIFLWSSAFVAIRTSLESFTPGALAFSRFTVAAISMAVIYFFLPKKSRITSKDKILIMLVGAVTLGVYHVALNYGELTISAGLSSFIISLSPIFTTLFALIFLKEKLNIVGIIGLSISTVGMLFILFGHGDGFTISVGIFYVLLATISGCIFNVLQKPFLKKYSAIEVTAYGIWGSLFSFAVYLPAFCHEVIHATPIAILSMLYLGIFPAAVATITWTYALAALPAARASNFVYFMPLLTTLLGWLFLGEVVALFSFLGGLLALFGVWLVNKSYHQEISVVTLGEE